MPTPFLKNHSEAQYLKLEQHYINLYNFLESLLTITEGEDLDSDSQRLIHFNALCKTINEGVDRFHKTTQQVREVMFQGDSATTSPINELAGKVSKVAEISIKVSRDELALIVEGLDNSAYMLNDHKVSKDFKNLSKEIQEVKNG
jgi:hypothetical protein|tara:strand:- start:751 stop:1185 length:435 start_codon:yes stop_codon:yes gene_type:complete